MRFYLHQSFVPKYEAFTEIRNIGSFAKMVEELGFDGLLTADNHLNYTDVWVNLALCAINTTRLELGTAVTNLITRDYTVTAGAAVTIDRLSKGRFILGLGSGDTPVRSLGRRISSLAEIEERVDKIKSLLEGKTIEYEGDPQTRPSAYPLGKRDVTLNIRPTDRLPVYLSAEGPKMMRLAARKADGVICGAGISKEALTWTNERLAEGLKERAKGSDPSLLYAAFVSISEDPSKAREIVRNRLANRARHALMATPELIPHDQLEETQRLIKDYDLSRPHTQGQGRLVTDYVVDRFAVAGNVDYCIERLKELKSLGINNLLIDFPGEVAVDQIREFSKEIIPKFSA